MSNIQLVALDMDGTSCGHFGHVLEENFAPIRQANNLGTKVVFVTGRPVNSPKNLILENNLCGDHGIVVGCNGAVIYNLIDQKIINSAPIPKLEVQKAFQIITNNDGAAWGYTTELSEVILSHHEDTKNGFDAERNFFDGEFKVVCNDSFDDFEACFKVLAFKPTQKMCDELISNGFEVAWKPGGIAAEVNFKNVNKKFAVEFLANYWNIEQSNTMAMGDGANDLSMMEWVGLSVAPSNAHKVVQEISHVVLKEDNLSGAVKVGIEKFVLENRGE